MTIETWAYIAEIVGAIAVVASLIYVGRQIHDANRVNEANARHNISEFVLQVSMFNAQHADRLAEIEEKLEQGQSLSRPEKTFQWWSHMNLMLHAETYFHHHALGLMPDGHWNGYVRYVEGYANSPGFVEFWRDVGPAFSRDFCNWLTGIVNETHGLNIPMHDQV